MAGLYAKTGGEKIVQVHICQAFLKMSQKIFKIGPDGFGAYLL